MIDLTTIPIQNPSILSRMADDEAVLVAPKQGKVKVLNEVGAAIWDLTDGKRNIKGIAAEICAQFDVEQSTAERDTLAFIAELLDREIVTITTG